MYTAGQDEPTLDVYERWLNMGAHPMMKGGSATRQIGNWAARKPTCSVCDAGGACGYCLKRVTCGVFDELFRFWEDPPCHSNLPPGEWCRGDGRCGTDAPATFSTGICASGAMYSRQDCTYVHPWPPPMPASELVPPNIAAAALVTKPPPPTLPPTPPVAPDTLPVWPGFSIYEVILLPFLVRWPARPWLRVVIDARPLPRRELSCMLYPLQPSNSRLSFAPNAPRFRDQDPDCAHHPVRASACDALLLPLLPNRVASRELTAGRGPGPATLPTPSILGSHLESNFLWPFVVTRARTMSHVGDARLGLRP